MKILYATQGTGNGHLSRTRSLAPELIKQGAQVDFVFSGRERQDFFDMQLFGDYRLFNGLRLCFKKGKIDYWQTLKHLKVRTFFKEMRQLDLKAYDLVISDFEPVAAWAARKQHVPCLALGHQYAFDYAVPKESDNLLSRLVFKFYAPADKKIGFHWHHFGFPLLPPLIHEHSASHTSNQSLASDSAPILVYLPFEDASFVIHFLQQLPAINFVLFSKQVAAGHYANVQVFVPDQTEFKNQLANCQGVICSAGFELPSEALQLGKRLLVKPVKGQMEQLSNAKALCQLQLAQRMDDWDYQLLNDWVQKSDGKQVNYPDVAPMLAKWILQNGSSDLSELVNVLWQEVDLVNVCSDEAIRALKPA